MMMSLLTFTLLSWMLPETAALHMHDGPVPKDVKNHQHDKDEEPVEKPKKGPVNGDIIKAHTNPERGLVIPHEPKPEKPSMEQIAKEGKADAKAKDDKGTAKSAESSIKKAAAKEEEKGEEAKAGNTEAKKQEKEVEAPKKEEKK